MEIFVVVGIVSVGCIRHKSGSRRGEASAPPRQSRGFNVYVAVMGATLVEAVFMEIFRQALD